MSRKSQFAPPFYLVLFGIAMLGLGYMMLTGVPTNNIGLIAVSLIFGFLFLSGFVLSKDSLDTSTETFTKSAQGWLIGIISWILVMNLNVLSSLFNIFTFPTQSTLATITEQISPFWNFINTVLMAPIVEELFWGIGLPLGLFAMLNAMGVEFKFLKNIYLQFIIVIGIGAFTFASFHTSATLVGFYIAAMFFRAIQTVLVYGDQQFDIIKGYSVPYSFLVGTHMANNVSSFGLMRAYTVLISEPFGLIILGIFILITVIALRGFIKTIFRI